MVRAQADRLAAMERRIADIVERLAALEAMALRSRRLTPGRRTGRPAATPVSACP